MQDKKFSVIIPLHKENYVTLDTCILHLEEQDYKNMEVIFVHNSPDNKSKKFLHSKKSVTKTMTIPWSEYDAGYDPKLGFGNHCRAFNLGAEKAVGDYLQFLDPDAYILPGILREYKDAFDKHPEVSFVYGDYDFEGGQGRVVGRLFNAYELKCANYVSGCFPIKKEAFKGWDESLQSLQDWDMWLSAVDAGATGHYIGRPCFTTVMSSNKDNISWHSATNWDEQYNKVRTKHGFPTSDTAVTSLGAPGHATNIAQILGADTRVYTNVLSFKPNKYKNIYMLGFYPEGWESHMKQFYQLGNLKGKLAGKRRIIHWIGTDIWKFQHQLSWVAVKNITGFLNDPQFSFIHLTEAQHTHDELAELGIESDIVPLPPLKQYDLMPLPKEFTVGVYINPTQDMYFEQFMYDVADTMPKVKFKFFGNPNRTMVDGNKEWVGWVDMGEFLPTISTMVRCTVHDGLPLSPIQAMMAGRNVVSTTPMFGAIKASMDGGYPIKEEVIKLINSTKKMGLNVEGSVYWKQEMDLELYRQRMSKYLVK